MEALWYRQVDVGCDDRGPDLGNGGRFKAKH